MIPKTSERKRERNGKGASHEALNRSGSGEPQQVGHPWTLETVDKGKSALACRVVRETFVHRNLLAGSGGPGGLSSEHCILQGCSLACRVLRPLRCAMPYVAWNTSLFPNSPASQTHHIVSQVLKSANERGLLLNECFSPT